MKYEPLLLLFQWKSEIVRAAAMRRSTTRGRQQRHGSGPAWSAVTLRPEGRTPVRRADMELSKCQRDPIRQALGRLQPRLKLKDNLDLMINLEKLWR